MWWDRFGIEDDRRLPNKSQNVKKTWGYISVPFLRLYRHIPKARRCKSGYHRKVKSKPAIHMPLRVALSKAKRSQLRWRPSLCFLLIQMASR